MRRAARCFIGSEPLGFSPYSGLAKVSSFVVLSLSAIFTSPHGAAYAQGFGRGVVSKLAVGGGFSLEGKATYTYIVDKATENRGGEESSDGLQVGDEVSFEWQPTIVDGERRIKWFKKVSTVGQRAEAAERKKEAMEKRVREQREAEMAAKEREDEVAREQEARIAIQNQPSLRKVDAFPQDFVGQTLTYVCYLAQSPYLNNRMEQAGGWELCLLTRDSIKLTHGGTFVGREHLCVLVDEDTAKRLVDEIPPGRLRKFAVTFTVGVEESKGSVQKEFFVGRVTRLQNLGEGGPSAEE